MSRTISNTSSSKSRRKSRSSDDRNQSKSTNNNYHTLGLAEDILINTQLYGIYNPYNFHSFINTWNFFFPQDCEICNKSMYPLMSGACQCLRCNIYVHRDCLKKVKQKCIYFTFDKISEQSAPVAAPTPTNTHSTPTTFERSNTLNSSSNPSTPTSNSGVTSRKPSVVRQIIRKVSIPQLQQAGSMLIGTVAYLPMIAASTIINTTTSNLSPISYQKSSSHSQSSSHHSDSHHGKNGKNGSSRSSAIPAIPINKELNLKVEVQLEKIIEKACMIPRMIGYLPEPKSQFCLWTSSLRAIALLQSASFMNYNNPSSSNQKTDNLYYVYSQYLKRKREVLASVEIVGEDVHHPASMLPRESIIFNNSILDEQTSRHRLIDNSHRTISSSICEEILYQQDDTHLLYDHPYDESINEQLTILLVLLLNNDYISISFPSQVCYVCILIFLSMDFKTILEDYDNMTLHQQYSNSRLFTNIRRNRTASPNSPLSASSNYMMKNPLQYALHISNPHYHMVITMKHARECIDTIITAILSKYDTTEMEEKYLSQDNDSNEFLSWLTRIVERQVFDRYQQAVYDKIFRECMILSSLLHEKYIEQMNSLCSDSFEESEGVIVVGENQKNQEKGKEQSDKSVVEVLEDEDGFEEGNRAIKMVKTPTSQGSSSKDQHNEKEKEGGEMSYDEVEVEGKVKDRLKELHPLPTFTLQNPQYLKIYNEYATKIKRSTSPIDKLKIFVLFLQFLTNTQDQITVIYPELKQRDPTPPENVEESVVQVANPDDLWNVYVGSVENLKSLVSESDHSEMEKVSLPHTKLTDEELLHAPNIDEEEEEAIKPVLHQRISVDNTTVILSNTIEEGKPVISTSTIVEEPNESDDETDMNPRSSMIGNISTDHAKNVDDNKLGEDRTEIENEAPYAKPDVKDAQSEVHEPRKSLTPADTDDLLEKLTIIMHYQQENRLIDWIAECIYLSSPILNKQNLSYGIDSYALVTFQQAVQLILTSYYHLQPSSSMSNSSKRLAWHGNRTRISSGEKNYYYSHADENEDYYFWKVFL